MQNVIRYNVYGDVIESRSLHDQMQCRCRCRQATVDGGLAYARRIRRDKEFAELAKYKESRPVTNAR